MKTVLKRTYLKTLSTFRYNISRFNVMASVKGGRPLIALGIRFLPIIGLHTTSAKVRAIVIFLRRIANLFAHNGAKGACLYLKANSVVLQQAIGGHVIQDMTGLKSRVSRTNRGLPRIIPIVHREMIRKGDLKVIKLYLTLFNLYRVITFEGDYRYDSLAKSIVSQASTTLGFDSLRGELLNFIPTFYKWLVKEIGMNPRSLKRELMTGYREAVAFPLLKSSPFTMSLNKFETLSRPEQVEAMVYQPVVSSHPLAIHEAANALENNAELRGPARFFLDLLPEGNILRRAWFHCIQFPIRPGSGTQSAFRPILGKLSLKAESAGKVRVFAMVDVWTQWFLKPLHDVIFEHILPGIQQDGTRDQLAPIYRLLKRDPSSLFSLDLSSATDRLPLWLQKAILAEFTGDEFAQSWASLLVDRDYSLSIQKRHEVGADRYRLRYAVGQPMGALSSWASLALTHHFIVQFCAWKVGKTSWFTDYAVLGDDIVISDPAVAKSYLWVMRVLGVGIGLHKSLLSGAGIALEFAKRTFYKGSDVSPIPVTELIASWASPASAVQFIKKYNLKLSAFLKACGFGYKVLGQLHKPLGKLNSKVRLIILAMNIPFEVSEVEDFFNLGIPKSGKALFETQEVVNQMVDKEFKLLQRAVNALRNKLHTLEGKVLHAKEMAQALVPKLAKELVSPDTYELVAWAEAQLANKSHLEHWVKGEGFLMSPIYQDALGIQFQQELEVADANPDLVLRGAERLHESAIEGQLLPLMKLLQEMTQGASMTRARLMAQALKDSLNRAMLQKYDITAAEMFITLIAISKEIALIPVASLQYARVVDAPERGFTDGMHIRLWKALAGLAQGTYKPKPKGPAPAAEFKGWW